MKMEDLVDQLIPTADQCGSNQVPAVYRFLLKAFRGNEAKARAEFVRYLKGELSPQMLYLAHAAVDSARDYDLEATTILVPQRELGPDSRAILSERDPLPSDQQSGYRDR